MKILRFLLEKEFRQIFRNKGLLPLIFVLPLVQLIILPLAADYEVRNINIAVVDHDHSDYSRQMISKITASGYFRLTGYENSYKDAFRLIEQDRADLLLEIPAGFEKNLVKEGRQVLYIAVNAINGTKAGLGGSYLNTIIKDYNAEVRTRWIREERFNPKPVVEVVSANWYNPSMNYNFFMVPGILAVLVTMMGSYLTALNIVKEKETGTIEQINVTPVKKLYFILGKLLPLWILSMFVFSIGLWVVARMVYGIVPQGSIFLLYGFLSVYMVAILGFGLLISTYSQTQQQAMSVTFFFVMIFLLMSGLFTSVDSMPGWAKVIAWANPVTYFIEVMRMIVLKGSGFADIRMHFLVTIGFAVFFNTWAVLNYRKTTG
jgi:ABC-2 type transport system permease protein